MLLAAVGAVALLALIPVFVPSAGGTALAATPGLRTGDRGADVVWIQLRLTALGHFSGPMTGYFGPLTETAVRRYQRAIGLAVSGVVGPQTAGRLVLTSWLIKIARGDTLESIAGRYQVVLGDLLAANPRIVNPNRIYEGQTLAIPATPGIQKIAGIKPGTTAAVPASGGSLTPAGDEAAQKPAAGGQQTGDQVLLPGGAGRPIPAGASVVLTFDDGPDPEVLPRILEVLRRNNCRAVFFFCGEEIARFPDLVKTVHAQGHSVQSHGWRHEPVDSLPETRISAELDATARLIANLTGQQPIWFRPPGGVINEAVAYSARRTGHNLVFWQNIGGLPDSPGNVDRLDRYIGERTVIMLPGADPLTAGYLQALLDRWRSFGVNLLSPADLARTAVVW